MHQNITLPYSVILGVGNDIIEIARIEAAIGRLGQRFLDRLFTKQEQAYCLKHRRPATHFAARFAAKEAVYKAIGGHKEMSWLDVEVVRTPSGQPSIELSPKLQQQLGSLKIHLSISHCRDYASAVALALQE